MKIIETAIAGALIIEPKVFGDPRGFFMETWNAATFAEAGLDMKFVQDKHSRSQRGVLRGLHFPEPRSAVQACAGHTRCRIRCGCRYA